MPKAVLLLLFSFTLLTTFAQEEELPMPEDDAEELAKRERELHSIPNVDGDYRPEFNLLISESTRQNIFSFDNRYQGVQGSPYWVSDWTRGDIQLESGTWVRGIPMKYDVFRDQILVYYNGTIHPLFNETIKGFNLTVKGKTYRMKRREIDWIVGVFPHDFSEILYEGEKHQFYYQPHKKFMKANFKGPYNMGQPYDEFKDTGYYLFSKDGKYFTKFKLSKRALYKNFPNVKTEIRKHIKANKIKVGTVEGMVEVMEFLENG
ncbi:MAG: hypothetical protein MRZ79_26370 [Bacteroidia bacterium]|nr:hypothetical protein [Bacteroidia bacterium]